MNHAAGGLHPLRAAGAQVALVAHAVLMPHVAIDHVGEGNEAPMGMVGKSGDVVVRIVTAEVVQHQERIKSAQGRGAKGAMHGHAGALGNGGGLNQLAYGSNHDFLLLDANYRTELAIFRS